MAFVLGTISASAILKTAGWTGGLATMKGALTGFVSEANEEYGKLERGASEVVTLMGKEWEGTVDGMMDKIRQFATESGRSFEQVYQSAYQAVSASVPEQDLFPFLDKAHELALATNSDLKTSTDILTTTMNAYGLTVDDVDKKSEELFATVRLGKTTLDEINSYAYQLIPTSAALGLELTEVLSVFTALTKQGVPSAQAFQRVNAMLVDLSREGSKADKNLRSMGQGGMQDIIDAGGGMVDILELIDEWVQTTDKSYTDFFTRQEAGMAAASAASQRGRETVVSDLQDIETSQGEVSAAAILMEDTVTTEWDKTAVAAENLKVSVGESFEGLNRKVAFEVRGIIQSATNMWNAIFNAGPQDTTTTLGAGGDQNQRDLVTYMNQLAQQTEGDSAGALIRMGEWSSRLRGDDWASAATRDTMPLLPGIQTQSFAGLQKFDWHGQSWLWNPVRREFFNEGTGTTYTADQVADMAASNVRTSQPSAHPATGYMDPRTAGGDIPVTTTPTTDVWTYLSHQQQYSDWIKYGQDDDGGGGGISGGGGTSGDTPHQKAMRLLRQGIVSRVDDFGRLFPTTQLSATDLYDFFKEDAGLLALAEPTGKTKGGLTELFGEVVSLRQSDPVYLEEFNRAKQRERDTQQREADQERDRVKRESDADYRAYLSRKSTFEGTVGSNVRFWQSRILDNEAFGGQTLRETFEDDPEFKQAALDFFGRRTGGDADAALELGLEALDSYWEDVQTSTEFLVSKQQETHDAQVEAAEKAKEAAEKYRRMMEDSETALLSSGEGIASNIISMMQQRDVPINEMAIIGTQMLQQMLPGLDFSVATEATNSLNRMINNIAAQDQLGQMLDRIWGPVSGNYEDETETINAASLSRFNDPRGPSSRLFFDGDRRMAQYINQWECDSMGQFVQMNTTLSKIERNQGNKPAGRQFTVNNYHSKQAGGLSVQNQALI